MNRGKYIATANKIASDSYGLVKGNQYIIEQLGDGNNWVYDLHRNYITASRTDAFDDYEEFEETSTVMDYNERMQNESDKHSEYMEMKSMYEEGLLER